MRELEYWLVDVFTEEQLAGNQLAVFTGAAGLGESQMQRIAREMNLSETTFIVRRKAEVEREQGVSVRIFTTQEELPFAGHPTLGTTAVLAWFAPEQAAGGSITLDLKAGRVPVALRPVEGSQQAIYGEMRQLDPVFGQEHSPREIAALLGLSVGDLRAGLPVQTVSTGSPFAIVVLNSLDALGQMRLDVDAMRRYRELHDCRFLYALAPTGDREIPWRARMQFYNGEDPATGSAAGCAISYLVAHGLVQSGEKIHLQQGVEIGRTSDLYLSAERTGEGITEVRVAGCTVVVAKGRLFLE